MIEENLFVYVEGSSVKHAASWFSVTKKCHKKKEKQRMKVTPEWTDISGPGPVSFLSRSSMYYITLTLHNPTNLLNVISTNSYYMVYKRAETAGTCPINNSNQNPFVFPPFCQE